MTRANGTRFVLVLFGFCVAACSEPPGETAGASSATGFILKAGDGELLLNGIVVKASPAAGTDGSILVEQTFQRGGTTNLHIHDQGDELFYVVSGRGTATLGDERRVIGPGDVIFVPTLRFMESRTSSTTPRSSWCSSWTARSWSTSFEPSTSV